MNLQINCKVNDGIWSKENFDNILLQFDSLALKEILKGNSFDKQTRKNVEIRIRFVVVKEAVSIIEIMAVSSILMETIIKSGVLNEQQN